MCCFGGGSGAGDTGSGGGVVGVFIVDGGVSRLLFFFLRTFFFGFGLGVVVFRTSFLLCYRVSTLYVDHRVFDMCEERILI